MSRSVFALDITDFRPMNSRKPLEFLSWVTRRAGNDSNPDETLAARLQAGRGGHDGIELIGAWCAVGVTGHKQFRAYSLYECHGGWSGGWRQMMSLYDGVPDSLFLSSIDDLRFEATTIPLVGAAGSPAGDQLRSGSISGSLAMIEFATVRPGAARDYLDSVRELRADVMSDYGHTLAGLYEVAFSLTGACTLWVTDLDGHVALQQARDATVGLDDAMAADQRLAEWESRSLGFLSGDVRQLMLAAYPGPVLSPRRRRFAT